MLDMLHLYKLLQRGLFKRCYSTKPMRNILEQLNNRSLIRVAGNDASEFLQGLITNDIHHLSQHSGGSMYTMFLNTKGRVLYDAIIYKPEESNSYFVECDKEAIGTLQRHLKIYRVRRKVEISNLDSDYVIYVLFDFNSISTDTEIENQQSNLEGMIVPCTKLKNNLSEISTTRIYKDLLIFKDPRVFELGSRIITRSNVNVKDQLTEIIDIAESPDLHENYKIFRYTLGIGEGSNDLPSGNCFPLESNCDYLHGISFHKGCYIGQELTARTHHTGIVRKRLMPLYFTKLPTNLPKDNVILHENVNLGKLRGVEGTVGLALLRVSRVLDLENINVGNGTAKVKKPIWWPIEAPKEKMNVEKN